MVYIPREDLSAPTKEELKEKSERFGNYVYETFIPKLVESQNKSLENKIIVS